MPAEPRRGWQVQPLREIEAEVPLPYRIDAVTPAQTAVTLGIGDVVTVDSEGLVRNANGTPILRFSVLTPDERSQSTDGGT